MNKNSIKFREYLSKLVLNGEKNTTWRLFDDKNLSKGEEVDLINWNTKEKFGEAVLTEVWEKKMKEESAAMEKNKKDYDLWYKDVGESWLNAHDDKGNLIKEDYWGVTDKINNAKYQRDLEQKYFSRAHH